MASPFKAFAYKGQDQAVAYLSKKIIFGRAHEGPALHGL